MSTKRIQSWKLAWYLAGILRSRKWDRKKAPMNNCCSSILLLFLQFYNAIDWNVFCRILPLILQELVRWLEPFCVVMHILTWKTTPKKTFIQILFRSSTSKQLEKKKTLLKYSLHLALVIRTGFLSRRSQLWKLCSKSKVTRRNELKWIHL